MNAQQLFWQEVDQKMNTCEYFERDFSVPKAMVGNYVREGKSCYVEAKWDSYLIDWYFKHPKEIDKMPTIHSKKELKEFVLFLKENKWKKWYKPRERARKQIKELFQKGEFSQFAIDSFK